LRPDFKTTPATLVKLYRILEILINNLKKWICILKITKDSI
jgi:hypothetical protein